ncbi:MAG: nucleoside monophosphate kinase [Candidatus Paceibacterota bacterium]|jgi:adenylate kinase family enzyme
MKGIDFPVFKTKVEGVTEKFDLNDPESRKRYFAAKAGPEIEKLKNYLKTNTFVGYLLGKKNSGKGTYSKLFMEAVGRENIGHVAVGDIVRDVHLSLGSPEQKQALTDFLAKNYRGFHSLEEIVDLIEGRSQEKLVSTELILALLKYEISKRPRQAIFVDGFPRGLDQINYALFLKELLGYRDDPDFFVFIDLPETIIDERIKYRVICPICKTPRNLKLLATKDVGYDKEKKEFFLICDNPVCGNARMVTKEGDELGIEPIRARLEVDGQIFKQILGLTGVPKVYLRNALPAANAKDFVDDYEITPGYSYEYDEASDKVKTIESPWTVNDDDSVPSFSLLPPAVVVGMIKQIAKVLEL